MDIAVKEKGIVYGVTLDDIIYARDVDNNEIVGAYEIKLSREEIKIKGNAGSIIFTKFGDNFGFDLIRIDGDLRRGKVLIPRWWAANFVPILLIENYKFVLKLMDLDTKETLDEIEVYKAYPLISRRCGGLRSLSLIIVDRDGISIASIEDGKIKKMITKIRGEPLVTRSGSLITCTGSEKLQRCKVIDCDGKTSRFTVRSLPTLVTAIPVLGGTLVEIPRSEEFTGFFESKDMVFTESSIAMINERGSMRFLERGRLSLEDAFRKIALVYNFESVEAVLIPENVRLFEVDTLRDGALIDSRGRVIAIDWETDELKIYTP